MTDNNKIKNIIPHLENYMEILIDEEVEKDNKGNYMINIGYTRVSTDKQADEGYGLEVQKNKILDYCRKNALKNLLLFTDDGYTGTKMERPALSGIISMINQFNIGKSKIKLNSFIVPKIDRLGRTLLGTLQFIQDYLVASKDSKGSSKNHNEDDIDFISVDEPACSFKKDNPQGKFLLMLFATLAEFDRDVIVGKLRAGRRARVASGKWLGGGKTPYGYRYDKELGMLVIVPEEAEIVREIFRLYIEEKMSPAKIAERFGFKGERIVTQILRRKSLTGAIVFCGEDFEGEHEPIITPERFEEAQCELENRSISRGESFYMLSGLLECGVCGAKMRYQKWNRKTGECKIVCYSRQSSKKYLIKDENCDNEYYWQSDIENAVIGELFSLNYLVREENTKTELFTDPIKAIEAQIKKEEANLANLYLHENSATNEVLRRLIAESNKKLETLRSQLEKEKQGQLTRAKIEKAKDLMRNLESAWEHMSEKEKQSVCRELIEKVVIGKNGAVDVHLKLKNYLADK